MDNYHYLKRQLLKKGPAQVVASCQVDSWKMIEFAVRLFFPSSSCLKISFNAGTRWSIYHPREQAGEYFEIRSTKIRCESSAIDKNEGFLFFAFLLFSLLCFTFPFIWTQKEVRIFWGLRNTKKKKERDLEDKICMLVYITWVFFLLFFVFLIIFLGRGKLL